MSPSHDEALAGEEISELKNFSCFSPLLLAAPSASWHLCFASEQWSPGCAPQEQKHLLQFQAAGSAAQKMEIMYVHINEVMRLKIYQNKWMFFLQKIHCREKLN